MGDKSLNLQKLIDSYNYNQQKRDGLIWLFSYLYSLPSMKEVKTCTPGTSTLARCGEKRRSKSTIQRYLCALIELKLLHRKFPDGRKHILISTELGQKLYDSRKQNPELAKAESKIDPLSKIKNHILYIKSNYNHQTNSPTRQKPVLKNIDMLVLRSMIKKCTESEEKIGRLEQEIKWSIEKGWLMCKRGNGTYHLPHDAVRIAVHLVKNGNWETPHGFEDWLNNEHKGVEIMDANKSCEICGEEKDFIKQIVTEKGPKTICPSCYCKNLNIEFGETKKILWNLMNMEYMNWRNDKFNYKRFHAFKKNNVRFDEPDPEEEPDCDKIVINFDEIEAYIRVEGVVENYFRFKKGVAK